MTRCQSLRPFLILAILLVAAIASGAPILRPLDADAPAALARRVGEGLEIVDVECGALDASTGEVSLIVSEAHVLERGRRADPLPELRLTAGVGDLLDGLLGIGDDPRRGHGVTTCVKDGVAVPVGVGAPTLALRGVRIGPR